MMNFITNIFNDGGPLFMYSNLIILVACIGLIVRAFLKKEHRDKSVELVKHLSLFALVLGFFAFFLGITRSLDSIAIANDIAPQVLAVGLIVGLIPPTFSLFIFLIARLGIIAVTMKKR